MIGLESLADNSPSARNFLKIDGEWDRGPAQARVFNSANISIANATVTALTFDSERYDTGNFHEAVTNPGRLTAPTAGLYSIGACVAWAANATGVRFASIRLNGTTEIDSNSFPASAATDASRNKLATEYQLVAGDYVEVVVFQRSTAALNVSTAPNFSPEFWIHRIGSQA